MDVGPWSITLRTSVCAVYGDYVDDEYEALTESDELRRYRDLCAKWDLGLMLSSPDDTTSR